jgi:hypothetical protein
MSSQVTSRGCSRSYIVCVLWHAWEHVRLVKSTGGSVTFPFKEPFVEEWLIASKEDCTKADFFNGIFGGTEYSEDDSTTFWTLPSHFFTWYVFLCYYLSFFLSFFFIAVGFRWKNNIERKSKFAHLLKDATEQEGTDKHVVR